MSKDVFDKVIEVLHSIYLDDFANICVDNCITSYDVDEVLDILAPLGYAKVYCSDDIKNDEAGD